MDRFAFERGVRVSGLPATVRHVLLTLATYADPSGRVPDEYTPSLTALAEATGLARRTVAYALNVAEEGGWVRRARPAIDAARSRKERTSYVLALPASARDALASAPHALATSAPDALASARVQSGLVHQMHSYQPAIPTAIASASCSAPASAPDALARPRTAVGAIRAVTDATEEEARAVLALIGKERPDIRSVAAVVRSMPADEVEEWVGRVRAAAKSRAEHEAYRRGWHCRCGTRNRVDATRCRQCRTPRSRTA